MIQDIIITICITLFIYAILPQIYDNYKHKRCNITYQTSIITAISMIIISVCFLTLGLYISFVIEFITGILWVFIAFQRYRYSWYSYSNILEAQDKYYDDVRATFEKAINEKIIHPMVPDWDLHLKKVK